MSAEVEQGVAVLKNGGIIAYPTEAVYGLGCDPRNLKALERLIDLKQRSPAKGFILVAASVEQVKPFVAELEEEIWQKVRLTWPGALTWLLPVNNSISPLLYGKHYTIAVRVSAHPVVVELCESFAGAIVSTSANPSFKDPAKTSNQVQEYFADKVDYIVEGEVDPNAKPSEIRHALTDEVIRAS